MDMVDPYLSIPSGDYSIFVERIRLIKWWVPAFFITLFLAIVFFEYLFIWNDFAVAAASVLEVILGAYVLLSALGRTELFHEFMSEAGFKISTSYPGIAIQKFPCRYDDQLHTLLKLKLNVLDKKIQIMSARDCDEIKILAEELVVFSPEIKKE